MQDKTQAACPTPAPGNAFPSALQPAAVLKGTDMKAEAFEATNGLFSVRLAGEKRNSPNGILAVELPEGRCEFTIEKP